MVVVLSSAGIVKLLVGAGLWPYQTLYPAILSNWSLAGMPGRNLKAFVCRHSQLAGMQGNLKGFGLGYG